MIIQPSSRVGPQSIGLTAGQFHARGRVFQAQTGVEFQIDQLGGRLIYLREQLQRLVEFDQDFIRRIDGQGDA